MFHRNNRVALKQLRLFQAIWRLHGLKLILLFTLVACPLAFGASYVKNSLYQGKVMRWHDQTKTVYVTFIPATSDTGWKANDNTIVKSAFSAWQQALNNRLQFVFSNDPKLTDIQVKWVKNGYQTEIGNQEIKVTNTKHLFTNADINFSLNNNGRHFTNAELKFMALHEIGHVLGIKGHSPYASDIMAAQMPTGVSKRSENGVALTANDKATIQQLYNTKASITNPVGAHLLGYRQFLYYERLANADYLKKNYTQALKKFTTASTFYSQDDEIHYFIGVSAYFSKQYDIAVKHLGRQMQIKGAHLGETQLYLASSLCFVAIKDANNGNKNGARGKFQQAVSLFQQVQAAKSVSPDQKKQALTMMKVAQQQIATL